MQITKEDRVNIISHDCEFSNHHTIVKKYLDDLPVLKQKIKIFLSNSND